MILINTPYRTDKNLGLAYNNVMKLLGPGDSACFIDGDVMFLTPDYGTIIEEYSLLYPDAVLTCYTNRIHHLSRQLYGGIEEHSIKEIIHIANFRSTSRKVTEIMPGEGMSGFLMVVPKKIWEKIPFVEGIGCLGVDSQFRMDLHKAGVKTLIMDGLLIWHTYRLLQGVNDKSHLL